MTEELTTEWQAVIERLEGQFGGDLDLDGILFLIGIQELGHGPRKFSKDQKLDVLHIAVCTLLTEYGYYEYEGRDEAGWPHWKRNEKLPHLAGADQEILMKQAIVDYFRKL